MMQRGKMRGKVGIDNAATYGDDGTGYGLRIASWLLHDATRLACQFEWCLMSTLIYEQKWARLMPFAIK